jgi:hypothetical protein
MGWGPRSLLPTESLPPDPTKYELTWGEPYPCLRIASMGQYTKTCPGMMQRTHKRAYQFDHELWYHFKCNKCGREADDLKVDQRRADDKKVNNDA